MNKSIRPLPRLLEVIKSVNDRLQSGITMVKLDILYADLLHLEGKSYDTIKADVVYWQSVELNNFVSSPHILSLFHDGLSHFEGRLQRMERNAGFKG